MQNILLLSLLRITNSLPALTEPQEHPVTKAGDPNPEVPAPPIFHHPLFKLPLQSIIGFTEGEKENQ